MRVSEIIFALGVYQFDEDDSISLFKNIQLMRKAAALSQVCYYLPNVCINNNSKTAS